MIADISKNEVAVAVTEEQQSFVAIQELDLMYVGGGGASGLVF